MPPVHVVQNVPSMKTSPPTSKRFPETVDGGSGTARHAPPDGEKAAQPELVAMSSFVLVDQIPMLPVVSPVDGISDHVFATGS